MIIPNTHGIWSRPSSSPFVMSVKTDNAGVSASNQFKIPLKSTGIYDFVVYWGDGSHDTITAYNQAEITHTYGSIGTYLVSIYGTCDHIYFSNTADRLKLLDILKWGDVEVGSLNSSYFGCSNLVGTWTDTPNLTNGCSFLSAFRNCSALSNNDGFIGWDVSGTDNFNTAFTGCSVLNADISGWNVSSATAAGSFMLSTGLTTATYNAILIGWAAGPLSIGSPDFNFSPTQYTISSAQAARNVLTGAGYTITDGGGI